MSFLPFCDIRYEVIIFDLSKSTLIKAKKNIENIILAAMRRGLHSMNEGKAMIARLSTTILFSRLPRSLCYFHLTFYFNMFYLILNLYFFVLFHFTDIILFLFITLYYIILHYVTLYIYYIMLHCIILYYIILYYIILYYIVIYYIILHYIIFMY